MAEAATVLVTGGAGFIGSHLVDRLLAQTDRDVVVLDNLRHGSIENLSRYTGSPRVRVVRGDIRRRGDLTRAMRGASVVYHLAAAFIPRTRRRDLNEAFATNVVGTFAVLRAALRCGVRRVVFTSSRTVYGTPLTVPVDEGHPLASNTFEGASKAAAEALCRAFHEEFGLDIRILRLAEVYGPRDRDSEIGVWIDRATSGQELVVSRVEVVRDVVWVGHVVDALVRAGDLDVSPPPINIGSGTGTSSANIARRIAKLTGGRLRLSSESRSPRRVAPFVASVDRMRELLEIQPPSDPLSDLSDLVRETPPSRN